MMTINAHITLSHKKIYKQLTLIQCLLTQQSKKINYVEQVVKYFDYNKRVK